MLRAPGLGVRGDCETLMLPTMSLLTGLKATEPSLSVVLLVYGFNVPLR